MSEDELRREMQWLAMRIARLEALLREQGHQVPESEPETSALPEATPESAAAPPASTTLPPPVSPPTAPPTSPPIESPAPRPVVPRPTESRPAPPQGEPAPVRSASLEWLVGAKLAAWVGAVAIVIAVGLLVKLGLDAGLWTRLPPLARALVVAAGGAALILSGEFALRRISPLASVGLFGAGLGTLYIDAFATFRYFRLTEQMGAFLLMAVVAAIAFGVTWRTRFRTIGVLALVEGYLTPLLLSGAGGHDLEVLVFLTALLGTALGLSFVDGRAFRPLRYVAFGGQSLLSLLWLASHTAGASVWIIAVVFFSIWWTMVLFESVLTALREESRVGNIVMVLAATAAYVSAGTWILRAWAPGGVDWQGLLAAGVAVLGAATALHFGPGLDGLRRRGAHAMDALALAIWIASGVLAVVAIALQFDGFGQSVGWLALAVGAIELGRRLPSRGMDVFALVVVAMAIVRVVVLERMITPGMSAVVLEAPGFTITKWGVLALIAVGALAIMTWRVRLDADSAGARALPPVFLATATFVFFHAARTQGEGLAVTWVWLAWSVVLLLVARTVRRRQLLSVAILSLTIVTLRWALIDGLEHRMLRVAPSPLPAFINGHLLMGIAIAAAGVLACRLLRGRGLTASVSRAADIVLIGAAVVFLIAISFEIDGTLTRLGDPLPSWLAFDETPRRIFGFCGVWLLGGLSMFAIGGRDPTRRPMAAAGVVIAVFVTVIWITAGASVDRALNGRATIPIVINARFLTGVIAAATLAWMARRQSAQRLVVLLSSVATVTGLCLGSLEIDQALGGDPTAVQAGLSVFWAMYAVAMIVVGFARPAALARYAGLALLAVTALKVLFVDLAAAERLWRVASFLVSGLLLVATSILYTKLQPRDRETP